MMLRTALYNIYHSATWAQTIMFVSSLFKAQPPVMCPSMLTLETLVGGSLDAKEQTQHGASLADCIWLAVPKRKVTPGKKRMKTTNQKRIKKKDHIIVDSRTGEITLRHRLPFNWKDYLPGNNVKEN
mmetsp:Transcript_14781/g.27815  ORF Transcript_14781/g.27815 Transcript_14781/m.27815 type:complete len:127 (+) Transcript_14781:966-1346(+)